MTTDYQPWTEERENELMRLREQGHSYKEIAHMMGRTASAIAKRLREVRQRMAVTNGVEPEEAPEAAKLGVAVDLEIEAMRQILGALDGLNEATRRRVLRWVNERFIEAER